MPQISAKFQWGHPVSGRFRSSISTSI